MKALKLMPFLSMDLSTSASQSGPLVSKLVSRDVSKSVSKSATSQSSSQWITWSCMKNNQNTMTESFLCKKGIQQSYPIRSYYSQSISKLES